MAFSQQRADDFFAYQMQFPMVVVMLPIGAHTDGAPGVVDI
jgi:hypothetical protein